MFRWSGRIGLSAKIALLGVSSVLITAIALLSLAVWQSGQYNRLAQTEVDGLIEADLDHITQGIYNLVQAENEAVQQQIDYNLNVARQVLANANGVSLSPETAVWKSVNQLTDETTAVPLPKLLIGGRWLGQNAASTVATPVVDEVTRLVGATATIFQRMNEQGDMLRVATTVTNKDGRRAIGTYIPAVAPDGAPNPVIAAIMKGETYHGRAFVVDAWYLTAYAPITDVSGNLVGMLYVGVPQKHPESRIRQAVLQTQVGKTGYVFVLSGQGKDRGHYVVSQKGERDGEDIWGNVDSDGRYVVRDIIHTAMTLDPGKQATIRYRWQNPGEDAQRWKIARLAYYKPWDWVIGASTYEDELQAYRAVLSGGRIRMTNIMGAAGLALTFLVGLLGILTAWTITRPVRAMTKAVKTITRGDVNQRVDVRSRDEIGVLAKAFNVMTRRLARTIKGLRTSEEKFRYIFDNAIEGLFQTTVEGRFLSASPAMAHILGYASPDELMASVTDLRQQVYVDPEQRNAIVARAVASNGTVEKELQFRRKDGQLIWGSLNIRAMRDSQGRLLFLQGFLIDITERRRSQIALQRYQFMVENATQEVYLVEPDGRLAYVNHAAIESLGYTEEEMLALGVPGFDPTFGPAFHEHFLAIKNDDLPLFETVHVAKDGRRIVKEMKTFYLSIDGQE